LSLKALCFAVSLAFSFNALSKEPLAGLERISFSSFRPDGWDIWLLSPNRPPQRLTDHPALDYDPAWSPDGRYIVFTSERSGVPDLFVIDTLRKAPERPLVTGHGMKDQAALTPDGHTLIFVSTRDGKADLYTLPFHPTRTTDVGLARRLTGGNGANLRPTFSPDGRRIIFTSTRDAIEHGDKRFPFAIQTSGNLYAMELASGEVVRLTHTDGWDGSAVYSPDGKLIYFYSDRAELHEPRLFSMKPDGSDQRPIGPSQRAISPALLPDGRIAFETWDVRDDGGPTNWRLRALSRDVISEIAMGSDDLYCHRPVPQPKGQGILCHGLTRASYDASSHSEDFPGPAIASGYPQRRVLDGRPVAVYAIRNAFSAPPNPVADEFAFRTSASAADVISSDGKVLRPLLNLDGESLHADRRGIMGMVWSPDGQNLAFAVKRFRSTTARGEIWQVRADGSGATAMTGADVTAAGMPDYGAGGTKIVFAAKVGDVTNIMMMNADGSSIRNLTHSSERENFPALSPDGDMLAYASDREGLLDASTGERRMALYIAKLTAEGSLRDVRRFTDPNTQSGHPRFSPDGRWLVYTSGVSGINDEQPLLSSLLFSPQPYGEIWAYRISDGVHVRLTDDKWEDGAPFWAPALNRESRDSK
jgi:Tol biopolymer transport system component